MTVGAIEGLAAALMSVIDPGDQVMLPSPTYATHLQQVRIASGEPVFVPSIEDEGFRIDLDRMEAAVTPRTRAILYCTPVNPTGAVLSLDEIRGIGEIAKKHNLMVITDEAYEYFTYDGYRHYSLASLPGMAERTISCYTFTKTYVMTGWRIGYLHADSSLIPQINKAHIPFSISRAGGVPVCCPGCVGGRTACDRGIQAALYGEPGPDVQQAGRAWRGFRLPETSRCIPDVSQN